MRIPRIYTPQHLACQCSCELEENASHHISRVLRMQKERELILFNGNGGEYRASIIAISKKTVTVMVHDFIDEQRQSPLNIELAIAISKGDRMDWVIQKATELGVYQISPLMTERTEIKLTETRLTKKMAHWNQVAISASEQSQRTVLPQLHMPVHLNQWLPHSKAEKKYVLHHRSNPDVLTSEHTPNSVALLIGPEGGLSQQEIELALTYQFAPLALGPRVLRTETAPIAAISILQYYWGDMSSRF